MRHVVLFLILPVASAVFLVFGGQYTFLAALPWFIIIGAFAYRKS